MRKPIIYESIAMLAALVGALMLVGGLLPFINPGFFDLNFEDYSPRKSFLILTLLSLPILGLSWHFNKKAQSIKRELKTITPKRMISNKNTLTPL